MQNLMNRSEQLASLRDIFFSELMCLSPEAVTYPHCTDYLVEIGVEVVREFHFDTVTVDDLKHQAFMAMGEYTDTLNNQWDGFDRDTYQDLEYQAQI
jgi:hypothetical protein